MSYDISLVDADGNTCEVERHADGGAYVLGGITVAELNVTYNYGEVYHAVDPDFSGLRDKLNGQQAKDTIEWLSWMVKRCGAHTFFPNYWAPTPGNAGYALNILLGWAKEHPEAYWAVD